MPKGLFTQSQCILLKDVPPRSEVQRVLTPFNIAKVRDAEPDWMNGGTTYILPFRESANGYAAVDVVEKPWPDSMGDPKSDAMLFATWTMGHFGPFTFPNGLERAAQQSWGWDREAATAAAHGHKAFIRILTSYVFGGSPDAPVIPKEYDPVSEMEFVTQVARALLSLPQALAYFNPNGEVLYDLSKFDESIQHSKSSRLLPLDLWMNVRLFNLDEEWLMMDTVGAGQLDLPDVEACFRRSLYDPGAVSNFLRNVTWYLHTSGVTIKTGETMDGPGNIRWRGTQYDDAVSSPPRRVLTMCPTDGSSPPKVVSQRELSEPPAEAKPWWKFWN